MSEEEKLTAYPPPNSTTQSLVPTLQTYPRTGRMMQVGNVLGELMAIGSLVWLIGLLSLSLYYLLVTLRFGKRLATSRRIEDEEVLFHTKGVQAQVGHYTGDWRV